MAHFSYLIINLVEAIETWKEANAITPTPDDRYIKLYSQYVSFITYFVKLQNKITVEKFKSPRLPFSSLPPLSFCYISLTIIQNNKDRKA